MVILTIIFITVPPYPYSSSFCRITSTPPLPPPTPQILFASLISPFTFNMARLLILRPSPEEALILFPWLLGYLALSPPVPSPYPPLLLEPMYPVNTFPNLVSPISYYFPSSSTILFSSSNQTFNLSLLPFCSYYGYLYRTYFPYAPYFVSAMDRGTSTPFNWQTFSVTFVEDIIST